MTQTSPPPPRLCRYILFSHTLFSPSLVFTPTNIGDYNVNLLNKKHHLFSYINDILCSFSLSQVVPSYTHVSNSGVESLIDLALLSDVELLLNCTTVPPLSTSDHLGISVTLSWKVTKATRANSRKVWLYSRGNYTRACQIIEETDWDQILNGHDVDTAVELWTEKYLSIMNACIPSRHLPTRQNLLWLSTDIVHLIRKRNIMFRKAKKTMKFSHKSKYKHLQNKVVALLRRSKNRYFNDLANTDKKSFWKSVKTLNKNRVNIPSLKL